MKKQYRVKKNLEFKRILSVGKKAVSRCFAVYYAPAVFDHDRVGISVGKKIGNAVERNKAKRQLRMMWREISAFDSGYDFIVIARPSYSHTDYGTAKKELSVIYNSVYNNKRQTSLEGDCKQ